MPNLPKITADDIKTYLDGILKTSSSSTYDRKLSSLKKFFAWAQKQGYFQENAVEDYLNQKENQILSKVVKAEKDNNQTNKPVLPFYSSIQARLISKFEGKSRIQNFLYKAFYSRPQWYKTYHSISFTRYIHFAILTIFSVGLVLGIYDQFRQKTTPASAYPTSLVTPKRYLSFQGRLTNQYGNPVTGATNVIFKLWDHSTDDTEVSCDGGGDENCLWSTQTCSVDPDEDGIFNVLLGTTSGADFTCAGASEITSDVFSENAEVWLGVKVHTDDEATPRIQIATVAYALNAETLQGYPIDATGSATKNTVVTMNNGGEIVIGENAPKIKSVSGNFLIQGQTMTLSTPDTSNGSITINPDGTGTLNLTFEGAAAGGGAGGFVNATNANITSGALYYGEVASAASGYDFIQFKSGVSPTEKFAVDNAGNTDMAGDLSIAGADITGANGESLNIGGTDATFLFKRNDSGTVTLTSADDDATAALTLLPGGAAALTLGGGSTTNINLTTDSTGDGEVVLPNDSIGVNELNDNGATPTDEYCLTYEETGGYFEWQTCGSGGGGSYWVLSDIDGTIYPVNETLDVLFGGTATASAKIGLINLNTGIPTINLANQASNIAIKDATANTLQILEGANSYLNITTSNATESMSFGNATTNPSFSFLGSGLITTGGDLKITGNDIQDSGGNVVLSFDGSGNIDSLATLATTITQSGDNQVTFTGNVDAQNGLDVTTANLTVGGANFSVAPGTGNITTAGDLAINGGDITSTATTFNFDIGNTGTLNFRDGTNTLAAISDQGTTGRLAISDSLQIGSLSTLAYSRFGTATTNHAGNLTASNDLLISGDTEIEGILYLDGGNIANSAGTGTIIFTGSPLIGQNALSASSWLIENTANVGLAALTVNQTKAGDIFTASASGSPKFVIDNAGNVGIGTTSPVSKLHVESTTTGKALAILNETGTNDIFAASASGTPKFTVTNVGNIDLSGIVFSAGGPKYFPIMYEGQAQTDDTFFNGFSFGKKITITGITISAKTAPTGANLTIDLLKNDAAQSNQATLTAGSNSQTTTLTPTIYSSTDTFGLKITSVGSTEAGRDMIVIVHYQEAAGGDQVNYISIPYEGTVVNNDTVIDGIYLDSPITIKKISLSARTAPTGANLTIDLLKNGSTQSRTTTLTDGSTFETTDITDTGVSPGERLGVKVTGIGSTAAGESLQVILQYTHDKGDTGTQYIPLLYYGLAQNSDDIVNSFTPDEKFTVAKTTLFTRDAPTGANLTVDLLKNDSLESRTATLHDGFTYQSINIKDDAYNTSDSLGLRITGIGSTFSGESVLVMLHTANIATFASAFMSAFEGPVTIGSGDYNDLTSFTPADGSLFVSGSLGVSGIAYLEGGTAWTSADIAEAYPTLDNTIEAGDVVTIATSSAHPTDPSNPNDSPVYVKKVDIPYDNNILGIISTKPAGVMGVDKLSNTEERKVPVSLIGRVPVKIASGSAGIKAGDYITSSNEPGKAMKAEKTGPTIGKVLEDWTPESDKEKIMVFVNVSWYDPDVYLTDTGELNIVEDENGNYAVKRSGSTFAKATVDKVGAFAQIIAANINAGAIETKEFTTKSFVAFQGTVDNLIIKSGLVSPSIKTAMISPLTGTDLVINLQNSATDSGTPTYGELIVKGEEGKEVALIDASGNATFSGTLDSDKVKTNDLYAGKIYADEIVARNANFAEMTSASQSAITREEIEAMLKEAEDNLANLSSFNQDSLTATNSANISELTLENLFITDTLAASSLSLSNSFTLGNDLVIQTTKADDGTILANSIDTLSAPLQIQSLAMAPLEIMAGKFRIETNGNVFIEGNLFIAGTIESQGLTLKPSREIIESGFGNLLEVQDLEGQTLASIDASGSARFNEVFTKKVIIAGSSEQENSETIIGNIQTNATAGKAVIPAGVDQIIITNPNVTNYTLVYVTPTSSTKNNVLYIKAKDNGYFVVGFNQVLDIDVSFNWWVIN